MRSSCCLITSTPAPRSRSFASSSSAVRSANPCRAESRPNWLSTSPCCACWSPRSASATCCCARRRPRASWLAVVSRPMRWLTMSSWPRARSYSRWAASTRAREACTARPAISRSSDAICWRASSWASGSFPERWSLAIWASCSACAVCSARMRRRSSAWSLVRAKAASSCRISVSPCACLMLASPFRRPSALLASSRAFCFLRRASVPASTASVSSFSCPVFFLSALARFSLARASDSA